MFLSRKHTAMFASKGELSFILVLMGAVHLFLYVAYMSHTRHPWNMSLTSLSPSSSSDSIPGKITRDKAIAHLPSKRDTMREFMESHASKITENNTINTMNSDHIREYHLEQINCSLFFKRNVNRSNYADIREELHRKIAIPKVSEKSTK